MNILHKFILFLSYLATTIFTISILMVGLEKNIKTTKKLMIKGMMICTQE
ncbi:MAG: hypothetical protein HUJ77_01430 [Clostridium sp.]|nr:hypothetical protein [Clostridium sp.]MCF0147038.1 hypothetical protein [Clostridium sp.]